MDELSIVEISGKEYAVLDEKQYNDIYYVYLVNPKGLLDFCIRKIVDEKKELLLGLDSEEEFRFALKLFEEKNKEDFN